MDKRRLMAAARKYAIGDARLAGYNGITNIPPLSLVGRDGAALVPVEFFYVVGELLYLSLMLCVARQTGVPLSPLDRRRAASAEGGHPRRRSHELAHF